MLHYSTIYPATLQLLKQLQRLETLKHFHLVGGTSLALQIGHRISIDLDLFTDVKTDLTDVPKNISHLGAIQLLNQTPFILNLFVNEIKVDFVSYRYPFIGKTVLTDNLKLASIKDIAAMKLAAITGRGSKKDFIDLFFILRTYSLPEIFGFFREKFPDGSEFLVFKSLTYFEDAEIEPMPKMLEDVKWFEVKQAIIREVQRHFP